ncbi:synthetase [Aureococcus anophagefferens]|nr:synthetase [Aureococcus anophagefferens]
MVRGRWLAAPNPALQELQSARGWQFVLHKQGVKVWKRTGCDDHANFAVKATMTMPCTAQQLASILTTRDYDVIRRFNPTIVNNGADLEWRDGRRERITYILTKPVFPLRPRDFVCRVRRERIGDAELIKNEAATHRRARAGAAAHAFRMSRAAYAERQRASLEPGQREAFWLQKAVEELDWFEQPTTAVDLEKPTGRWFPDGVSNLCHNALDRHVAAGLGAKTAISYVSAVGGASRDLTYAELLDDVARFAGGLAALGVEPGDRVLLYMPMIPEAAVAMLASSSRRRCGLEGAKGALPYMPAVDEALDMAAHDVPHVVVAARPETTARYELKPGRDVDFRAFVAGSAPAPCARLASGDPLYTIYTSGTTGEPKGILRDNSHPLMLKWSMEHYYGTSPDETFFAASDIGWVVGHSYIVYGPLLHGATSVMFEGKPVGTPDAASYWRVVEARKVANMFTAPTALRAIRKFDPDGALLADYDVSSLRALFVAGERADPDTVAHFENLLGIPVVDHWWQTESGSPMCGVQFDDVGTALGSCALPLPGYDLRVLDAGGAEVARGDMGSIAIKCPLPPGFMTTLYEDDARFREAYLDEFPGYYSAGDAGYRDEHGYFHILTRTDDIINVAGHRLSTGALEEAIQAHPRVVECACVGVADALKGMVPLALVVTTADASEDVEGAVVRLVRERVGAVAALRACARVAALPKTRSGKILRKAIRAIADGDDTYTLPGTIEDATVVDDHITPALSSLGYPRTT